MSAMYVYYEGCGYESEPFEAASDKAAEEHVMTAFRSPTDVDFDGDEGGIIRLDCDEDGDEVREPIAHFAGENMIPDPFNQRGSYDGMAPSRAWR